MFQPTTAPIRIIAWPWPALIITPGLFLGGFDSPFGQSTACLLASCLLGCMVIDRGIDLTAWRRFAVPLGLIAGALGWLLAVACVHWLSVGTNSILLAPDLFLPSFLGTLSGFWAFVAGISCCHSNEDPDIERQADWILLGISIHALVGLGLFLANTGNYWSVTYQERFAGMIGNSNVTACVCGTAAVLAWSKLVTRIDRQAETIRLPWNQRDPLRLVALIINLTALVLTASRIATLFTFCVMMLAIFLHLNNRAFTRKLAASLACLAFIVITGQWLIADGLVTRLANSETDLSLRLSLWAHYGQYALSAPWTGVGPGAFPSLTVLTAPTDINGRDFLIINSPHNIVLQLLLVGGLPYLCLIFSAAALVVHDIVRSLSWQNRAPTLMALTLAASVIPVAGAADIALDMPASVMIFAALAGMAWARAGNRN